MSSPCKISVEPLSGGVLGQGFCGEQESIRGPPDVHSRMIQVNESLVRWRDNLRGAQPVQNHRSLKVLRPFDHRLTWLNSVEGYKPMKMTKPLANILGRRTPVVSLSGSQAGKWGNTPILFRNTLHQLNDHRKQMIPGLNSHSGASDIANHDVETGPGRPDIDRRHGTKLW